MSQQYSYLALGDSYTVGTSVPLKDSFPYQTVGRLRQKGFNFTGPEILAAEGWTTDELEAQMKNYRFLPSYDFITLLIGVNNQYRGRSVEEYKLEFERLLNRIIPLSKDKQERIFVVSIPDYGITPFASAMDVKQINTDINLFNSVNKALSIQYKVKYLDISADYRESGNKDENLSGDGLHPSSIEYNKWSEKLSEMIARELK